MTDATQEKAFVHVAKIGDLQNGTMKPFAVSGHEIFLARVQNNFYAADNICPHMGERLTGGRIEGTVITCPRDESKFDLIDGRIIRWTDWTGIKASVSRLFQPPHSLGTYPVKVNGDNILVQI